MSNGSVVEVFGETVSSESHYAIVPPSGETSADRFYVDWPSTVGGGVDRLTRLEAPWPGIEPPFDPPRHPHTWMNEAARDIMESQHLTFGWDGYDAPPPNELAAKIARLSLTSLPHGLRPNAVAPSVEGGITLSFFLGDGVVAALEIGNSGEVVAGISGLGGPPITWTVPATSASFAETFERFAQDAG